MPVRPKGCGPTSLHFVFMDGSKRTGALPIAGFSMDLQRNLN